MRVALFTLGGTIASTHEPGPGDDGGREDDTGPEDDDDGRGDDIGLWGDAGLGGDAGPGGEGGAAGGVAPRLTGADLLAAVPGLSAAGAELEVHDVLQVPGASITMSDVIALAGVIRERIGAGASGAVVSQGTDTIEETAFLLDLLWDGDAPVVVTGAMRNPALAGADGPANLLAAVTVAASPDARGLGCLVVLSDEIHAARYVRKAHTTSVAAFTSPSCGPLGLVTEGRALIRSRPVGRPGIPGLPPIRDVRTGLVTMVLGDDGELLRAADGRFDGLVVAGYGAGHVPASVAAYLGGLAARIPVVIASRTGAGMVLARTYAFPGSELDLRRRGLIGAGVLDPLKARILLHVLLAGGADRDTIAATFRAVGADVG